MSNCYDETLPMPTDVKRAFDKHAGDGLNAIAWLEEHGIEPAPIVERVGKTAVMDGALAVPIHEGGEFVDLLLIRDDDSHESVTGRAKWLGTIVPRQPVKIHARPIDWLNAGCVGVCHIAPFSRDALKQLRKARTIECDDIAVAFEAWDFGFDAKEVKLKRFVINDDAWNVRAYFQAEARFNVVWRASRGSY